MTCVPQPAARPEGSADFQRSCPHAASPVAATLAARPSDQHPHSTPSAGHQQGGPHRPMSPLGTCAWKARTDTNGGWLSQKQTLSLQGEASFLSTVQGNQIVVDFRGTALLDVSGPAQGHHLLSRAPAPGPKRCGRSHPATGGDGLLGDLFHPDIRNAQGYFAHHLTGTPPYRSVARPWTPGSTSRHPTTLRHGHPTLQVYRCKVSTSRVAKQKLAVRVECGWRESPCGNGCVSWAVQQNPRRAFQRSSRRT